MEKVNDWVTPEEVAQVMLKCVEEDEFIGGSIWEVAGMGVRKVEAFMDEGPKTGAHSESEPEKIVEDVWNKLGVEGWGQ